MVRRKRDFWEFWAFIVRRWQMIDRGFTARLRQMVTCNITKYRLLFVGLVVDF